MFSASATRDELTSTFRSLSQKRRHGLLSIAWGEQVFSISFYNGRIIDVDTSLIGKSETIIKKLLIGNAISKTTALMLESSAKSVAELHEQAVKGGFVSADQFLRAKVSVEMNLLYSLRSMGIGQIEFIPRIVHVDPQFGLSISPGQLLLDMVELDTEEKKFAALFADNDQTLVQIALKQAQRSTLNSEELEILRVSEQVKTCLADIRDRALLTEYELRQAIFSLYEKRYLQLGALQRGTPTETGAGTTRNNGKSSAADPEPAGGNNRIRQIDDAAQLLESISEMEGQDEVSLAQAGESLDNRFGSEAGAYEIAEFEEEGDSIAEKGDASFDDGKLTQDLLEEGDFVTSPLIGAAVKSHTGRVRSRFSSRILHFSSMLLQPHMVSVLSIVLNIAFLLALAIFVPTLIDGWFRALSALAPEV